MAVLPPDATFEDFKAYVGDFNAEHGKEPPSDDELEDLWVRRQKLMSLDFVDGRGQRSQLPHEEQHLTVKELASKQISEAKAQGMDPVYVGRRWV
jgi:hypothetical protein